MPYSVYSPETESKVAQVNAITSKYFEKTISQLAYEDSVLLKRLKSDHKVKVKGGTQIQWPVRVDKLGTSGSVYPRASVTWSTNDTRIAAQLNWKYKYGKTLIQWDELLQNQGTPQIISLVKDKLAELKEDMNDEMITNLYTDAGSLDEMDFDSIDKIIGTDTYAGIDPATLADPTRWRSIVDNGSGTGTDLKIYTDATYTSLASAINQATFGSMRPNLAITTHDIYDQLESWIVTNFGQVQIDQKTLSLGFDNIKFKGVAFVADPQCPDGHIFGIDTDALELVVHPDYDMKATPWGPHENYPNALFKGISWAGNLKSKRRHTHFKFTDIASVEAA